MYSISECFHQRPTDSTGNFFGLAPFSIHDAQQLNPDPPGEHRVAPFFRTRTATLSAFATITITITCGSSRPPQFFRDFRCGEHQKALSFGVDTCILHVYYMYITCILHVCGYSIMFNPKNGVFNMQSHAIPLQARMAHCGGWAHVISPGRS